MAWASAFEDAGRALIVRGHSSDAVRYLHEALDAFHEVGAVRDEARVRHCLRHAGIRPPAQRVETPARPRAGWKSLSSAELRVVRLVALAVERRLGT